MVKFLFVGDLHLRGTNPRNRIDDYKEVAKQKLKEVFKIAVDNAVDAILQPGDIFDRPEVGIAVRMLTMTSGGYRKTPRFNSYISKCFEMGLFDHMENDI